ncbi:hypothetical protein N7462_006051 [Penicillium macrosclerotiorum]|uniref:uncharacterized protein n=1 Tax=Penicillium macrosclerotiorum TaxID=303699 RepID=UPI002546DD9C|nr:uncharacterized protein N7462_006051 [Penicillium macrosclerotiorum]KAJ5682886.1 hypothetical protein N7462_006051 [Penicillium macrosclerotiorum]
MAEFMHVERLLESLSIEEKISLLAGATFSNTASIETKGVPSIKTADGPNGVRAAAVDRDIKSACFPAACSVAATFDTENAYNIGILLAKEARQKGVHCLLGPTVCIHRHPLGGRNFESFSEDPFLTGKLSAQVIRGLQDNGVAATIKHFVANEQETARMTVDETISERALREIYLRPFEIAIREASPWAIMTAYNSVNGKHCDANAWLLQDILRGEWKWNGLVMSDWGGTNSIVDSLNAGLDLEMPGPPRKRLEAAVLEALSRGEITESIINERARAVIHFATKLKALADRHTNTVSVNQSEDRAFIRKAGARGMVLLKNEKDLLPLSKEKIVGKRIALIGLAKDAIAHGGGSASVNTYYRVTPWEGMRNALGDQVELLYSKGFHRERLLPPIDGRASACGTVIGMDGKPGFSRLLYAFNRESGRSVGEEPLSILHGFSQSAYSPLGSQESLWKALEIVGEFTPAETGSHYFACSGLGPTQVFVDDVVIFDQRVNCADPMGALFLAAPEEEIRHQFIAGRSYRLRIRTEPPVGLGLDILEGRSGVRMGMSLESIHDQDLEAEAADVASQADVAIVFTGHDPQWESEGRDQDSFHLPRRGTQDAVITAVAAANPNTVVVNSTGVPIAMPWLENVRAVVQAWFPGQECGNSIADVLTGVVNPEGRLPVSFPRRLEDSPAYGNFPGEYILDQLKVTYAEGVFVGYRHYDRVPGDQLNFAFGHGLSYTTFSHDKFSVAITEGNSHILVAALRITNTGLFSGATTIQIYVGRLSSAAQHPHKTLVAFQKVLLHHGETRDIRLSISTRDFAYFDEDSPQWVVDAGQYIFYLGNSVSEILQTATLEFPQLSYKL